METAEIQPAHSAQRALARPGSLSQRDALSLMRSTGNRTTAALLTRGHAGAVQRRRENASVNQPMGALWQHVDNYTTALDDAVAEARRMILTKSFIHIPPIDGYMQSFDDNFDRGTNKFRDPAAVPRQAGYWIESYATKLKKPGAGGGLDVIPQPKRGNSRPDIVLQFQGVDVAWLDITSHGSEGHIFQKNSEGWFSTPYVTELTYDPLSALLLNPVAIPAASADIGALVAAAQEAQAKQVKWEENVLEKYGAGFAHLMQSAYYYVKESAVRHEDEMDLDEKDLYKFYSPSEPGNKFEQLAVSFVEDRAKRKVEARELASILLYWKMILARYERRYQKLLPANFKLPTKAQLGLEWVNDASGADGEPLVREWFPV